MTVFESGAEVKVKKSKKERRKERSSSIHQDAPNETNLSPALQLVGDSVENDTTPREKKKKRKEREEEDNNGDTMPKKRQKSHHRHPSQPIGGSGGAHQVGSETDLHKSKKVEKHKKQKFEAAEPLEHHTTASSPADVGNFLSQNSITIHGDVTPLLSFSALDIPDELRQCLHAFKEPTPIQACSWPPLLAGRDVVGIAETGR